MPKGRRTCLPLVPLREMVLFPNTVVPLHLGRASSLAALDAAMRADKRLVFAKQRDRNVEEPGGADLHSVGTVGEVIQVARLTDGSAQILVEGKARVTLHGVDSDGALVSPLTVKVSRGSEVEALARILKDQFEEYLRLHPQVPPDVGITLAGIDDPGLLADRVASQWSAPADQKQVVLEAGGVAERLELLCQAFARELEQLALDQEIRGRVRKQMDKVQREYFLKEQLKVIHAELGQADEKQAEVDEYWKALARAKAPAPVMERAERELSRLMRLGPNSAETGVIRAYLDCLSSLPWATRTRDRRDLAAAERSLERGHYGLAKVKERILEFLAVRQLSKAQPTTILCLCGPPGVGKTSLAQAIAEALGRKFVRLSLGGVADEAEIRGHRRTYVGAMPGRILAALKQAGTKNPVILLDELDKLGRDHRGNPAAALLEVLDPEQNRAFSDHYLELPFDLSEVLFIATANSSYSISSALYDRLEVIRISGYTEPEKMAIARAHLFPKALQAHGLPAGRLELPEPVLSEIIRGWTREAGVRQLNRQLETLCRKAAHALVRGNPVESLSTSSLPKLLGAPSYRPRQLPRHPEVGVACGLAWTEAGGNTMAIEVATLKGKGGLTLTGHLGDVMKESARAAHTYIKSHAEEWGIDEETLSNTDLHLHIPNGAIPKDGPSAGIAIAVAIASALSGRPVRSDVAMTGEISLRGRVIAIGGLKEKVLAAHRAERSTVILPQENEHDLEEIPEEVRRELSLTLVETLGEALKICLLPGLEKTVPQAIATVEAAAAAEGDT